MSLPVFLGFADVDFELSIELIVVYSTNPPTGTDTCDAHIRKNLNRLNLVLIAR